MTGWASVDASADRCGFQITFFRSRTAVAAEQPSRFAAKQLLFAHAALSDLKQGRLRHDQRIARSGFGIAEAAVGDTALALRDWSLTREAREGGSRYRARAGSDSAGFAFDFKFDTTQPLLLQGDAGYSRKGPKPEQASHYYSQPQLAVSGTLTRDGTALPVRGTAWLDHEWSDSLLDPNAVGWDWIGMNLTDGSALTAFRLRNADGGTVYAGGELPGARRHGAQLQRRRDPVCAWSRLDQPVFAREVPGRMDDRHAGRPLHRPIAARRPGTGQPKQHRRNLLGGPE